MCVHRSRPERRAGAACRLVLLGLSLVWAGAVAPVLGAGPAEKLDTIRRAIDETRTQKSELARKTSALIGEIGRLRRQSVGIAAQTQGLETALSRMENRRAVLAAKEAAMAASLDRRRHQSAGMLAALLRIARHPPTTLIALPAPPGDTVRSALLLRAAVPQIELRAVALSRELRALAAVRGRLAEARGALKQTGVSLDRQRGQLAALLERKTRLVAEVRSEGRAARVRIDLLGAEARDLRNLLARLSAARRARDKRQAALRREQEKIVLIPPRLQPRPVAPPPKRLAKRPAKRPVSRPAKPPPSRALARLAPPPTVLQGPPAAVETAGLPARGRVILMFGQQDGLGRPAKGITIETRRAAQVIAPHGGRVVFAGPFQGFGNLLIIEHRAGYHILLAGLARIDAAVGDRVLAGEPVGIMEVQTDGKPSLYVELRRRGYPINPLPWLAAGRTRIKG